MTRSATAKTTAKSAVPGRPPAAPSGTSVAKPAAVPAAKAGAAPPAPGGVPAAVAAPKPPATPAPARPGSCSVMDEDWSAAYQSCYWFQEMWRQVHDPSCQWPWAVQLDHGKLYREGRLCVPSALVARVIRAHHAAAGHISGRRLWPQLCIRYNFPPRSKASTVGRSISTQCAICQAVNPPNFPVRTKIQCTPVPARLGESIALDIFNLPAVVRHGQRFDCMVVAVDRLSGWVVAIPARRQGLQAQTVAEEMWEKWWQPMGVPATVSSDQGPQFIGAWWRALCAAMGVREVYSQAHHHSANGRAEMAGKTLQQLLRRIHQEDRISWVQALPRAVQQYHDVPGPSGLTPYEIVFGGRTRSMGGVPRQPQRECPDAKEWLEQGKLIDKQVAEKMQKVHEQQMAKVNEARREKPVYQPGDRVWLLRPRPVGVDKLLSWWLGPCPVVSRQGADSYLIEDKPGHQRSAHSSQLKPFVEDQHADVPVPLNYFSITDRELDLTVELDEWEVDHIIKHKHDESGKLWFLTQWQGYKEPTWEPLNHFVHRYNVDWAEYCKAHKLKVNVVEDLLGARALPGRAQE